MSTPAGNLVGDATINVNANTDPAAAALRRFTRDANGHLRDMRGRFVSESNLINTAFNRAAGGGSAFNGVLGKLKSTAIGLAPALIPIAAQAAPIAASVGAAAVAIGAFAAAAGGQVAALTQASEAEKKYKDAVDQHGAASKEAVTAQTEYVRQVKTMPPATREAAAALSSFKDGYKEWSDSLAGDTMPVATRALATFGAVFPKLTPMVQGAGVQLNRFATIAAGGVASPGFDRFMKSFSDFATGALERGNDMLIRFLRTLNTGKISGGFSTFMDYVRDNGPIVRETLSNVMQALANFGQAAANVGPGLLTVVNVIAKLVAALPPALLTAMLQLALAMKAVRLAAVAMAATSGGIAAFSASIAAMQLAAGGATGILPKLGAAIATLSRTAKVAIAGTGIGLLLIALTELSQRGRAAPPDVDKLTTSLARLGSTGKTTGEAAKAFGSDLDDLYGKVKSLTDPSTTDQVQQFLVGWTGWDSTPVKDAKDNLGAVDTALANLVKNDQAGLAAAAVKRLTAEYGQGGRNTKEFTSKLTEYKSALADAKFEQQIAADAMGLFGAQAQQTSAKLAEQKASADGLRAAIQALNDVQRAGLGGMIGFEASIDAASKAARENAGVLSMQGGQLTVNTDKQRAAATALTDLAAKTDEAAAANRESTGSWQGAIGVYERGRQQLIQNAVAMGLNRAEAEALAAQILKTPDKTAMLKADITDWKTKISEAETQLKTAKGDKKAKLTADIADWKAKVAAADLQLKGTKADKRAKLTADVTDWRAKVAAAELQLRTAKGEKRATLKADISDWKKKIGAAQAQINNLPLSRITTLTIRRVTEYQTKYLTGRSQHDITGATGGLFTGTAFKHRGYAAGGLVDGPGTETSDDVYAPWLSKNEFVVNAKQTAKHLPLLKAINSGGLGMEAGGMAGGGMASAGMDAGRGLASGLSGATSLVLAAARAMAAVVETVVRQELQISSPSKVTQALAKDVGAGFIQGLTGSREKIRSVAKDLSNDIRTAFSGPKESGLLKMVARETNELSALAAKRDVIAQRIADAGKFATSTAQQASSSFSLASLAGETTSESTILARLKQGNKAIQDFAKNIKTLQAKGLSKGLIRQLLELGPEQGAGLARTIAAQSEGYIKSLNAAQGSITNSSVSLGKMGADALYDAGAQAGKGLLAGLKAQQKQIEQLMLAIAKGMQAAIRKALGIKSPSTVMAEVGRQSTLGLAIGLKDRLPQVQQAVAALSSSIAGTTGNLGIGAPALAGVGTLPVGGTRRTAAGSGMVENHYHFHMTNRGMIGSQRELETWLVKTLDTLRRTKRLPAATAGG
jgi:trimeric autotransporter adhesin